MIIKRYKSLDSTNSEALRRKEQTDDFSVFVTDYQTEGRGQRGSSWESAMGKNLTFSLFLKPSFLIAQQQYVISQIAALGVSDYCALYGIPAKIKWPNDIYIDGMKIGGILIEHIVNSLYLSCSIVGIGLNINQLLFESDAPNPTSLLLELRARSGGNISDGDELSLEDELSKVLNCIQYYYGQFSYNNSVTENMLTIKRVDELYVKRLYRLGEFHLYYDSILKREFRGRVVGVDKNFRLLIEEDNGFISKFAFKEVAYL